MVKFIWFRAWCRTAFALLRHDWKTRHVGRAYLYVFKKACDAIVEGNAEHYTWYTSSFDVLCDAVNATWAERTELMKCERDEEK